MVVSEHPVRQAVSATIVATREEDAAMSVTADPETAEDVSESSETASELWAPQVCWQSHAIWRGTATFSDATDAIAAAGEVLRRLAPTTTPALPGSWPVAALETLDDIDGLSGVVAAGTIHLLPFDRREYRHENLTPLGDCIG